MKSRNVRHLLCLILLCFFINSALKIFGQNFYNTSGLIIKNKANKIKKEYIDLSYCPPRPEYFPEYRAHCWGKCKNDTECSTPVTFEDVNSTRAELHCIGNVHLIGVRKSGTTDVTKWFKRNGNIHYHIKDYRVEGKHCPIEWLENCTNTNTCDKPFLSEHLKTGYFLSSPGNLMANDKIYENSTHKIIITAMQYLGFMASPNTKFYVQLRNPTDRVVSYFYHWHHLPGGRAIYSNLTLQQMDGRFFDEIIRMYLKKLRECIAEQGEFYCAYVSAGLDGDMDCLLPHSMYVVYIKEAFKFIPREQFQFNTLADYSRNPVEFARNLTQQYFGVGIPKSSKHLASTRRKVGLKSVVWKSTLILLDNFYEPYNRELADLLGDDKWLFQVNRDERYVLRNTF